MADDLETEDLLAAYLSHDLHPDECARVERRLREDAGFQALAQELYELMQLLNKGNLAARASAPQLHEQLTRRLRACLPAAVFKPAPATRLAVAGGKEKPVLQLYVAPQHAWNRPRTWLVVAATLLFVAGGLALAARLFKTNNGENKLVEVTASDGIPNTERHWPQNKPQASDAPVSEPPAMVNINKTFPDNQEKTEGQEEKTDTPPTPVIPSPPPKQLVFEPPPKMPEAPPEGNKVEHSHGQTAHLPAGVIIGSTPPAPPVRPNTPPAPPVQPNTPAPAIQPEPPTSTPPAPAPVQPILPLSNVALVGAKLGNVQASGEDIVMVRDRLPSGTEIATGQGGKVALVFPGGGRLAVNINSDLVFTINDKTTSVTLRAGEISWHSNSGVLFLTAGGIQVSNAKGVDVKLTQNKLLASVTAKTATVGSKDKQVLVSAGFQAIANLNTDALPINDPYSGDPGSWSRDLVVPGDITVGPTDQDSKNNPKKRR